MKFLDRPECLGRLEFLNRPECLDRLCDLTYWRILTDQSVLTDWSYCIDWLLLKIQYVGFQELGVGGWVFGGGAFGL